MATPSLSPHLKHHFINLKNGRFDSTSRTDLDELFKNLVSDPHGGHLVVHFHGGLINEAAGYAIGERLLPEYQKVSCYPVFFVWESGLFDVLTHNLAEIHKEKLFQRLLLKVAQFALGKLGQDAGLRSTGTVQIATEARAQKELQASRTEEQPSVEREIKALPDTEELTVSEREQFEAFLEADAVISEEAEAIAKSALPTDRVQTHGSRAVVIQSASNTLMNPEIVRELRAGQTIDSGRGIFSFAALKIVKHAVTILYKVILRFAKNRDHGFHATIVEEILREFYVANAGGMIWSQMKKDTADAFGGDEQVFGGTAFIRCMGKMWEKGHRPKITLIGHSTGAVYIYHLLKATSALPADLRFNLVYLAPAADFQITAEMFTKWGHRIDDIRLYGMSDVLEKKNALIPKVPAIYPHSLLYFVSGLLEDDFDKPIVGMERYYSGLKPYDRGSFPECATVKHRLSANDDLCWSIVAGKTGRNTASLTHGDFDNDPDTLDSVRHVIENGYRP